MTSAQFLTPANVARRRRRSRLRLRALIYGALALIALAAAAGCSSRPRLQAPLTLAAPYERPQLWAVAPFTNESGVSLVEGDRVADLFVEQIEQVSGIDTVPVNRVILAMRRLDLQTIATPGDALALMNTLGVDGLVIGAVTAYDPYNPPKFGAAVQLFVRDDSLPARRIDPIKLTRATSDCVSPGAFSASSPGPVAQASGVFDAANHQTLKWIEEYAAGRTTPDSAYGSRIYLVDMELYTQFVAFRLTHDLLARERDRLMPPMLQATHTNAR